MYSISYHASIIVQNLFRKALTMLTSKQRETLLAFCGDPLNFDLYRDELLHEIFENTADKFPNKNAIETSSMALTFRQLDERANRFARHLRGLGIGVEDKVAFQLPRTEFVYVAMLGILKAGAAYVPLDPSYPPDRVGFILEDCAAKLFITSEEIYGPMRSELEKLPVPVLPVTPATDFSQSSSRLTRKETATCREPLAYIIYTSGTTGRPKGCLLEHRHICNEIRSAALVYGVVHTDRVFQGFSVAFDASLEEIWMAFFNGCTLVVGTKEVMQSGSRLADVLTGSRVTVLSCVPTLLSRSKSQQFRSPDPPQWQDYRFSWHGLADGRPSQTHIWYDRGRRRRYRKRIPIA